MKNTPPPTSAVTQGEVVKTSPMNVLDVCRYGAIRPIPMSGGAFFSAGSNDTHSSISQPYPFSTCTEMKPSLEAIGGTKQSVSGQNLNLVFITI